MGIIVVRCHACLDEGHVCESHPDRPWEGIVPLDYGACSCGAPGMPCPACCSPIPEDGSHSIGDAFLPDWKRVTHGF